MAVEYREFEKGDFLNLAMVADDEYSIHHTNIAKAMQKADNDIEKCILAVDKNEIVGYVYGFALPSNTLIPEFLYVLPQHRNKGIARGLLSKLEHSTNCTASMIFYHNSLHNLYAKMGYQAGENLEVAMKEIPTRKGATL